MDMREWAKREVELACERERRDNPDEGWDYGCACYESALKAFESLLEDDHSGFSIQLTKQILSRLIDDKPLTPIDDRDDEWHKVPSLDKTEAQYQHKRYPSLFKYVRSDGTVNYDDLNRYIARDIAIPGEEGFKAGIVSRALNFVCPITFPYIPADKKYEVICEFRLVGDGTDSEYDTLAIWYAIAPDGEKIDINFFSKEVDGEMVPITREEFYERRWKSFRRKEK